MQLIVDKLSPLLVIGYNYTQSDNLALIVISIYTLSDLGVLSNLIGSLSLANGIIHLLPSE